MRKELFLTSPIPESVNHYLGWRCVYNPKTKKYMAMSYETSDAKKYKEKFGDYVKEQVKLQKWNLPINKYQHFYVDCTTYFPRIDMDNNNYWKLILDTITETKTIWEDDNVVCERCMGIRYDTKNPRIELKIYCVDYIGIFDNREKLEEFESKCAQCTKYKEGKCSIYKKAVEGRIQEEINCEICSKYKEISKK